MNSAKKDQTDNVQNNMKKSMRRFKWKKYSLLASSHNEKLFLVYYCGHWEFKMLSEFCKSLDQSKSLKPQGSFNV